MVAHEGGWRHKAVRWLTGPVAQRRLILAGKAALAVGLAWFVAGFIPGDAAKYPYYAPLGALASMYSTVMSSVRNGLQTLAGLLIGLLLGLAVFAFGDPNVLTIGLAVGVGVLFGGVRILGAGSTWVATAALFVLVIGGSNAGDYSIGYLVQMVVGVAVGLLVNVLVMPGLFFQPAQRELQQLKLSLADQLDDISKALVEHWPPEHEDWSKRTAVLSDAASKVRQAVHEADESRRANPRQLLRRRNIDGAYAELRIVERITFAVQDLTELLTDVVWGTSTINEIPSPLIAPLSEAIAETSRLLRDWANMGQPIEEPERLTPVKQFEQTSESVIRLREQTDALAAADDGPKGVRSLSVTASIALVLTRILDFLPQEARNQ